MLKIYKPFFTFICLLFTTLASLAQNSTSSPYSRYGLGDITKKGFGQNQSMGGTSIGMRDSYHLNISNPASYSSIDSMSFIFEAGMTNKTSNFQTTDLNYSENIFNVSYLAMGFPVTKWWYSSSGVIPLSNVGYKIIDKNTLPNIGNTISTYYGSGGINQFYIGNSFKLNKNISIGINTTYLFGYIINSKDLAFPDDDYAFIYIEENKTRVSDIYINYGIQYHNKTKNNLAYSIGVIFDNKCKITSYKSITGTTIGIDSKGRNVINTIVNSTDQKGEIILPQNIGTGFSIGNVKFIWAADYTQQNWSKATFFGEKDSLSNSNLISTGFQYTPDYMSVTDYWKRISYRIGGHYSNTYLNLKENQLDEFGINFGLGLPAKKSKSSLNIGVEYSQRGSLENNLVKENYWIININLSLHDKWFKKHKID